MHRKQKSSSLGCRSTHLAYRAWYLESGSFNLAMMCRNISCASVCAGEYRVGRSFILVDLGGVEVDVEALA